MASTAGDLYLKRSAVDLAFNSIATYQETVQSALYDLFKIAYKVSLSNHIRGEGGDRFKDYISLGMCNSITGMLDIVSEMTTIAELIQLTFSQFETEDLGEVKEETINQIETDLASYKLTFDNFQDELTSALAAAASYITTTDLALGDVDTAYTNCNTTLDQIKTGLEEADSALTTSADELLTRIRDLRTLVKQVTGQCHVDGEFNPDQAALLAKQSWYHTSTNVTLAAMLAEDPFTYNAGEVTVSEDQWAAGLCSDVYAYAGYSFLSASYEHGHEGNQAFINARAELLKLNGYAQFTDYAHAEANVDLVYASIEASRTGYYFGKVNAEVGVAKVDASIVLGSDNLNITAAAEAKALCADGKAAFDFTDINEGEFAIGAYGSADAVGASVEVKGSALNADIEDTDTPVLLGFKAEAKAAVGVEGGVYLSSQKAIDMGHVNINATTLEIGGKLLIGGNISVTVPTLWFSW